MLNYVAAFALSLTLFVPSLQSQQKLTPVSQLQDQKTAAEGEANHDRTPEDQRVRMEQAQIAHIVTERQAQLRRDTEKLAALSAELKQNVDKTGVNILSMDVIKKAQEIQKLAKSVQDKMKSAF